MREAIFRNWTLFLGLLLLMISAGVQGSLIGIRSGLEGFGDFISGLIIAAYFAGMITSAIFAPKLISRGGHVQSFAAFLSLVSASMLSYPLIIHPLAWVIFRFIAGFCMTALYIVAESWLNDQATNKERGKLLSFYMAVQLTGFGGGQFLLNLAPPQEATLFIVTSILVSLALVPMMFTATEKPPTPSTAKMRVSELYHISPFGVVAMIILGMTQGTLFGLSGYYGIRAGLDVSAIAFMVTLLIAGSALFQWPLGRFSDNHDRRIIIGSACLLATVFSIAVFIFKTDNTLLYFILVFLVGSTALPTHSISLAHVNDSTPRDKMVAASGTLYLVYGCGSVFGPILAVGFMGALGANGFFIFIAVGNATLSSFAFYRIFQRSIDETRKRLMLFIPARSTVETYRNIKKTNIHP